MTTRGLDLLALPTVLVDGTVRAGDPIQVELPPHPHRPLEPV